MPTHLPAVLMLADGTAFWGTSVGCSGVRAGEVVFNTALTGYQEVLTDPSYCQQIVTLTCPLIGNVGANADDEESAAVFAAGLIVREQADVHSNWRATVSWSDYLRQRGVVAIADVDTRALTQRLRNYGAQNGCLMAGDIDVAEALKLAQQAPPLLGLDLTSAVSTPAVYGWQQGEWNGGAPIQTPQSRFHVVVFDYGVKRNILRILAQRGCRLTVLPATTSASHALGYAPDGIFLSNGPGDPAACQGAIETVRTLLATDIPIFGVCLGHQLMALASGASTVKMKFGHHGANHPVQDVETKRVLITSQNHSFTVDTERLPGHLRVTHISLFDQTLQGLAYGDQPAFSFQGHPEGSPGPQDIQYLFDRFIGLMAARSNGAV